MHRLCFLLIFVTTAATPLSRGAFAQELDHQAKFNIWSVVCAKQMVKPTCSVVAAVHSEQEPDSWAKVGLSITDGELEMILRVPRLTYVKVGLSLGFDGEQLGRAFLDRCDLTSCEATVTVGPRLRNLIGTRKKMTVEYPTSEDEGVVLTFDLEGVVLALSALSNQPGMRSDAVASVESWRNMTTGAATKESASDKTPQFVTVERRSLPKLVAYRAGEKTWSTPLVACGTTPATKEIRVDSDMRIENADELLAWLEGSKRCGNTSLVWVVPKSASESAPTPSGLDRNVLGLYAVYGSVKQQMPKVVISMDEKSRMPLSGSAGPEVMAISASMR